MHSGNKISKFLYINFLLLFITVIVASETELYAQVQPTGFAKNSIARTNIIRKLGAKNQLTGIKIDQRSGSLPAQTTLFYDIDFSSYDLLNANLSFSDKNSVQKIIFAPFRLGNFNDRYNILNNIRTNFTLKDGITTLGASLGLDESSLGSKRSTKLLKEHWDQNIRLQTLLAALQSAANGPDSIFIVIENEYREALSNEIVLFNEEKMQRIFKLNISINSQFFPVISSNNNSGKFDSTNHYANKGTIISVSGTLALKNNSFSITPAYNRAYTRLTAELGQEKIAYDGFSLNINKRIFKLVRDSILKTLDMYKKSLFVPSIHLGASVEAKFSRGDIKFSEDGAREKIVYTPFIDMFISPASQFRLTFPISTFKRPNKETGIIAGIGIQYAFKIINLSE